MKIRKARLASVHTAVKSVPQVNRDLTALDGPAQCAVFIEMNVGIQQRSLGGEREDVQLGNQTSSQSATGAFQLKGSPWSVGRLYLGFRSPTVSVGISQSDKTSPPKTPGGTPKESKSTSLQEQASFYVLRIEPNPKTSYATNIGLQPFVTFKEKTDTGALTIDAGANIVGQQYLTKHISILGTFTLGGEAGAPGNPSGSYWGAQAAVRANLP